MTRHAFGFILASALSLLASSARAQTSNASRSPWSVGAHVTTVWHTDASHDVFANEMAAPYGGFFVGRDLVTFAPRVVLSGELAWSVNTVRRRLFSAFDSTLHSNHFQAAVAVRFELNRWLSLYGRVAGGGTYFAATITGQSSLDADAWTANLTGGAGAFAVTPGILGSRVRFAAGVESGFAYVFPTDLALAPPVPEDDAKAADRLSVRPTALGALDASGAYLRVTLGLRF